MEEATPMETSEEGTVKSEDQTKENETEDVEMAKMDDKELEELEDLLKDADDVEMTEGGEAENGAEENEKEIDKSEELLKDDKPDDDKEAAEKNVEGKEGPPEEEVDKPAEQVTDDKPEDGKEVEKEMEGIEGHEEEVDKSEELSTDDKTGDAKEADKNMESEKKEDSGEKDTPNQSIEPDENKEAEEITGVQQTEEADKSENTEEKMETTDNEDLEKKSEIVKNEETEKSEKPEENNGSEKKESEEKQSPEEDKAQVADTEKSEQKDEAQEKTTSEKSEDSKGEDKDSEKDSKGEDKDSEKPKEPEKKEEPVKKKPKKLVKNPGFGAYLPARVVKVTQKVGLKEPTEGQMRLLHHFKKGTDICYSGNHNEGLIDGIMLAALSKVKVKDAQLQVIMITNMSDVRDLTNAFKRFTKHVPALRLYTHITGYIEPFTSKNMPHVFIGSMNSTASLVIHKVLNTRHLKLIIVHNYDDLFANQNRRKYRSALLEAFRTMPDTKQMLFITYKFNSVISNWFLNMHRKGIDRIVHNTEELVEEDEVIVIDSDSEPEAAAGGEARGEEDCNVVYPTRPKADTELITERLEAPSHIEEQLKVLDRLKKLFRPLMKHPPPSEAQIECLDLMMRQQDVLCDAPLSVDMARACAIGAMNAHRRETGKVTFIVVIHEPATRQLYMQIGKKVETYIVNCGRAELEREESYIKHCLPRGPVLVGTPERLLDLAQGGNVIFDDVKLVAMHRCEKMCSSEESRFNIKSLLALCGHQLQLVAEGTDMPVEVTDFLENLMQPDKFHVVTLSEDAVMQKDTGIQRYITDDTTGDDDGPDEPPEVVLAVECLKGLVLGHDLFCQSMALSARLDAIINAVVKTMKPTPGEVSVLVLCTQRDLVDRRYDEKVPMEKDGTGGVLSVSKEATEKDQIEKRKPAILITTPNRAQELIKQKLLSTEYIHHFVIHNCESILGNVRNSKLVYDISLELPEKKQVVIGCGMPLAQVRPLCKTFMKQGTLITRWLSTPREPPTRLTFCVDDDMVATL